MRKDQPQIDQPDVQQLLDLRYTPTEFQMLEQSARRANLTPVTKMYAEQLPDLGFTYSHEFMVDQGIGKAPPKRARMLVFTNVSQSAYAILTDLYHHKSWVYFTHYFSGGRRAISTCQPGALDLEPMRSLTNSADFILQNTGSGSLKSQWSKHQNFISAHHATEKALNMDVQQHLDAEREAYRKYTDLLLDNVILRQSDTQLVGFTHTGATGFYEAITSTSAKRPNPKVDGLLGKGGIFPARDNHKYRNAALAASAAIFGVLVYNIATYSKDNGPVSQSPVAVLPADDAAELPATTTAAASKSINENLDNNTDAAAPELSDSIDALQSSLNKDSEQLPEEYIVASEEDEMWRIAVENAEFYLMSNDGDPTPWIRTARKMAAGFEGSDPRLARTYFLAAMLEKDPKVAEQQYNRALSIQTKTLGLYHTETAQTLEALAWVAEGSRDALEEAITHQRLALNVYRSIFGEGAEDTRAALWKLQYFEDRLEGRRPKSEDKRRLLPALARFAR